MHEAGVDRNDVFITSKVAPFQVRIRLLACICCCLANFVKVKASVRFPCHCR
jgi:hypothetical protein